MAAQDEFQGLHSIGRTPATPRLALLGTSPSSVVCCVRLWQCSGAGRENHQAGFYSLDLK